MFFRNEGLSGSTSSGTHRRLSSFPGAVRAEATKYAFYRPVEI